MAKASKSEELARTFLDHARASGFVAEARDGIVTIRKPFTPGDNAAFAAADASAFLLLGYVPAGPGSVWGTDGGSVGGYSAIKNGCYCLNKSGVKKRFLSALSKLTAQGA